MSSLLKIRKRAMLPIDQLEALRGKNNLPSFLIGVQVKVSILKR